MQHVGFEHKTLITCTIGFQIVDLLHYNLYMLYSKLHACNLFILVGLISAQVCFLFTKLP